MKIFYTHELETITEYRSMTVPSEKILTGIFFSIMHKSPQDAK